MRRIRTILPLTLALVLSFFVIAGLSCTPPTSDSAHNGPSTTGATWNMVFEDNFDTAAPPATTTLNTADWNYGWKSSANPTPPVNSNELACYAQDHVLFAYNALVLSETQPATAPVCGGVTRKYLSGAIESSGKHNFTPGTDNEILFEAAIMLQCDSSGNVTNWPAWWLDGDTGVTYNGQTTPGWPAHGEIDIMEGLSTNSNAADGHVESTYHYGTSASPQHANFGWSPDLSIDLCDGQFHKFSAKWNSDSVTSYIDGQLLGSYTSATNVYEWPEFMILGQQMSQEATTTPPARYGGPVKSPSTMVVDYVRVYARAK